MKKFIISILGLICVAITTNVIAFNCTCYDKRSQNGISFTAKSKATCNAYSVGTTNGSAEYPVTPAMRSHKSMTCVLRGNKYPCAIKVTKIHPARCVWSGNS